MIKITARKEFDLSDCIANCIDDNPVSFLQNIFPYITLQAFAVCKGGKLDNRMAYLKNKTNKPLGFFSLLIVCLKCVFYCLFFKLK